MAVVPFGIRLALQLATALLPNSISSLNILTIVPIVHIATVLIHVSGVTRSAIITTGIGRVVPVIPFFTRKEIASSVVRLSMPAINLTTGSNAAATQGSTFLPVFIG